MKLRLLVFMNVILISGLFSQESRPITGDSVKKNLQDVKPNILNQRVNSLLNSPVYSNKIHQQNIFPKFNEADQNGERVFSPMDSNLTLIGQWATGGCSEVFIVGNYAYINSGQVLEILDITDPVSPVRLGRAITPEFIEDIHVEGNYAYIADDFHGLRIINISNPEMPHEVGFLNTPDRAQGVFAEGDYAYVADQDSGLRVVDVSNPSAPVEVGTLKTSGIAMATYVKGNYVYMVDLLGLNVIDISTPQNPTLISFIQTPGAAIRIFIKDSLAFIADMIGGFRIINISNPASPYEMGFYNNQTDEAMDVFVEGNHAYVAFGGSNPPHTGFQIFDVGDPTNPLFLGSHPADFMAYSVSVSGYYAYIANGALEIFDVNNPYSPTKIYEYTTAGYSKGIFQKDSFMYVADHEFGLIIFDISNQTNPVPVGGYNLASAARDVVVKGHYAYMAFGGFRIFDVVDPTSPVEAAHLPTSGKAYSVFVKDTLAYLADRENGLRIYNVSDPTNPIEITLFNIPQKNLDVFVSGQFAYVASGTQGYRIIDISNPAQPVQVAIIPSNGMAFSVFVNNSYAYLVDGWGYFRIFDVQDPTNPIEISYLNLSGISYDVYVEQNYAYVVSGYKIVLIDITNHSNPVISGYFDSVPVVKVFARNSYVYASNGGYGTSILKNDLITEIKMEKAILSDYKLWQNYPNPFNISTLISYSIPSRTSVSLKVFDINGELVETLVDDYKDKGKYLIRFDGSSLSSGVYLYQLKSGDFKIAKKAILLK